ncbi:MAG: hypothetical protein A2534_03580 [Candidatus Magasanikbacteria bacterium RIFOXYD2_FULL_39_9]|uniref:Uncharacterized protein n=1 Tax=Candidatus Magasanikbacteria bacterium RIFOXYD1_FULL_40_23 TaxID=1798705 RepID=A0A1F6P835_9BACT|nr:MAG: hypothetical protein A2563_05115 [Candidatus Magasanikbacteria bacterium RIFOXYD1_FULL_40_23]OGH93006.1 MAG: hypothetical protein A2534_03580 [Candidatus Magasanikbacteria bacterium RIFOXYD2_FULL_39_9]
MVQDNYKSWFINTEDFPKESALPAQLKFLLKFAILAPSTHNSQPWQFKIDGNRIYILPNFDKALPVGDKENHFLFLSLGCALENLLVAAQYYGFSFVVKHPSSGDKKIEITLTKIEKLGVAEESLISYIAKRITNRHKFTDKLPSEEFLNTVRGLSTDGINVEVLALGEKNNKVKQLVGTITPKLLNDPSFRKELSGYVKTNITKSKLGMPAFVMGVPNFLSLFIPTILKFVNIEKLNKKKQEGALSAAIFIVISAKNNNEEDWVKTGQVFQKINLLATKFSLFTHPMAAPLHDIEGRKELQEILQTNFNPQFLFRLGYGSVEPKHSPRMSVDDCMIVE